jgi:hypothetical protein
LHRLQLLARLSISFHGAQSAGGGNLVANSLILYYLWLVHADMLVDCMLKSI